MNRTMIPSYRGAYGVSEEIENDIQDTLIDTVKKLPTSNTLSILWNSALHREDSSNVASMKILLHRIASLETIESIGRAIGLFNRWQLNPPLTLSVSRDAYKSSLCRIHFYEPSLGIPNYGAYLGHSHILTEYKRMLKEAGESLGFSGFEETAAIEQQVYNYLSPDGAFDDPKQSHFEYTWEALTKTYPSIPFEPMLMGWGVSKAFFHQTTFVITNLRFMEAFNRMCRTFEIEAFTLWLQAYAVLSLLKYLPAPYDTIQFDFFGKLLQGKTEKVPPPAFAMAILQMHAPQFLGKVFSDTLPNAKQRKTMAIEIIHELKKAAGHRIQSLDWLQPATKEVATKKLNSMKFHAGYPSRWNLPTLSLNKSNLIENIIRLSQAGTVHQIKGLGYECSNEHGIWDDGIYIVNAFYYADRNQMVIPLGMLCSPFFDTTKSKGWNYGGIGCAIAHEMTHGFDNGGRMYDETGSWNDWWTEEDKKLYDKKSEILVKRFDGISYKGGKVNGSLTLDENLADVGGMAISLQACEEAIADHPSSRREQLQDFFTAYAISWRLKDREKKAQQALAIDRHAPPEFRVNKVVSQFAQFYEVFDIPEGSPMWVTPDERMTFW